MDYNDFSLYFWAYLNENAFPLIDRNTNNKDFYDAVCFDCFRIYSQSGVGVDIICKLAEDILFNVNRYKPLLGN